jgi:hypothetical protein
MLSLFLRLTKMATTKYAVTYTKLANPAPLLPYSNLGAVYENLYLILKGTLTIFSTLYPYSLKLVI